MNSSNKSYIGIFIILINANSCVSTTSCFANCASCSNSIVCTSCDSGYYLRSADECTACTYVGTNCVTCSNETHCNECRPGFWGTTCRSFCSEGCITETCNLFDGTCTCKSGFYGPTCQLQCSENCLTGTCGTNGECDCKNGYYGNQCNGNCFADCEKCSDGSSCSVCPTGRFGQLCGYTCECNGRCDILTGECITEMCPDTCASCRESNQCSGCTIGWYGARCNNTCLNKCNGGCEQYYGHCNACYTGYFGRKCDMLCTQCRGSNCNQEGECMLCEDGNYGPLCNKTCSEDCVGNTCNKIDGSCQHHVQCPGNCVSCTDSVHCTECNVYYYGSLCALICNSTCKGGRCDIESGRCENCESSYYGDFCENRCSLTCASAGCERQTGACFGCKELSVHGPFCNLTCSNNCTDRQCSQENGHCSNGCIPNHYGSMCDSICSENCANTTTDSKCDSSGNCLMNGTNAENGKSDTQVSAAVIGGAVSGLMAFVVIIVLIVVFLKRRRNSKPYEDRIDEIDHEYHTIESLHGVKQVSMKATTAVSLGTSNVSFNHVSNTIMLGGGLETATDDDDLEIDFDEERRSEKRKLIKRVEENVYYIGIQDIEKRKVKVGELAAFVAGKTLDYYEEEFDKFSDGLTRSCDAAKLPQNRAKNRYKGLYAYDATRVKVTGFDTDYINANYIDGFNERNAYIASLGPMSKQMGDFGMFWNMIWQQKLEKIVMVTNLMEEGKEKCERYWPRVGTTKDYSGVKVTCQSEDEYAEFTRRLLLLNDGESERQLHHLHFTAWPDRGIPEDVTALIEFRHRVLNSTAHLDGPTLVHCSAGIGRTGTYIALDILTKEGNSNKAVEIPGCIINMRQNRPNMVQTAEQYEFLHLALVHTLTFNCQQIPGKQFQDYMIETSKGDLIRQFKKITDSPHVDTDDEILAIERNKSEKGKNRSGADIPGDEYRPRLYLGIRHGDSDYVNAVFVHAFQAKRKCIVAQSPMPNTVQDFLTLAYQENCSCIVSFEQGDGKKDLGEYYPADNQELKKGQLSISCGRDNVKNEYSIQKWLTIEFKGSTQSKGGKSTLRHFEFSDWNQPGNVPRSPANYVAFLRDVKMASSNGPVLVHCRDGGSKSGLFCVMAFLVEKMVVEHEVSVVNAVRKVKARRPNAVPNQAQFDFCHDSVLEFVRSFKTYYSFEEDI
ncbi:receptor-type tyrosine-protein phosphatase kappa-like isoform X2 [Mya arenaria]|uniref:receptor-type tyrosine-protein phosphatase kappa-like isoform X2 n=1 Tax=Mya arenaria TaxID=6604 RepID=UPI0022E0EC64|nr:receptor-type tyrosine-protein phosphatase kappa-like isoform X2 [Mya arenaria]